MKTVRLTMAQALVRFLENQYIAYDGLEHPFVEGVIMLPGHGNVVGLGQALAQETCRLKVWQGKNEQGMAHTAVAFARKSWRSPPPWVPARPIWSPPLPRQPPTTSPC